MKIARDVCDEQLELIAAAGLMLDLKMISRLVILEVQDLYVEESGTEDIQPDDLLSDVTRRKTHKLLKRTFDDLMNIGDMSQAAGQDVSTLLQYDNRYANCISLDRFREVISSTIEDVFTANTETFEAPLVKRYLNRSYEHAMNVTLLSIMIGRAFKLNQDDLTALGTAAMLHDVGKQIFPDLVNKPLKQLDFDEEKKLRVHPDAGAVIISKTTSNSQVEQVVIRQHHEQPDGRGYPHKLVSDNEVPIKSQKPRAGYIFRLAEIVAVANTFDNLINGDLQVEAMTPAAAMECLVRGAGSLYNRSIVSRALELINVYPVGSVVMIKVGDSKFANGWRGVVRRSTGEHFSRPEVLMLWDRKGAAIQPRLLDLNKHRGIEVELI